MENMKPALKIQKVIRIITIDGSGRRWISGTSYPVSDEEFYKEQQNDLLNSLSERVSDLEDRIDQKG